jgi:hypothetical protein
LYKLPNELRIDAAETEKIKTEVECAAASIRVERSRTLENTTPPVHLEIRSQAFAGMSQPHRKSTNQ